MSVKLCWFLSLNYSKIISSAGELGRSRYFTFFILAYSKKSCWFFFPKQQHTVHWLLQPVGSDICFVTLFRSHWFRSNTFQGRWMCGQTWELLHPTGKLGTIKKKNSEQWPFSGQNLLPNFSYFSIILFQTHGWKCALHEKLVSALMHPWNVYIRKQTGVK